ncbi:MAG: SIS domain-containing protein [Candidatus Nanopelagicaceae bacterium]|nr:SIS domain-containing protein [Candidatus Nanopelagicaceae bacterium]
MAVPGQVMLREISEIPRMLGDIANAMSSNQSVKNLLRDRNFDSVIILARGTSDNAGHYLKYLLETQLGLPVGLASPSAATMYPTSFKYQNCLLIAISQSGQSTDLLTFAKAAQVGGGYLLSITNDENSPLAKLSDLHLSIFAGPELAVPATKSYVGQLMVSYLLTMAWANKSPDVDSIINAASSIVDDQSDYKSFAKHLDITKPIYVLGRGFSYPNAKEFALKLQETCLIPVQGMSSSDFLHGPIASLNSEAQVVFIASEHLPKESFGEAPQRVRNVTGKVLWIGNPAVTSNEDVLLKTAHTPSELTASISDAVAFQKITHELATSNGLNPDSPEGLSKVTITR